MLTLHQYQPNPKRPDVSAFCSKVEMFLKIHRLPYEGAVGNPVKAPKGKLPTLSDGNKLIADSENIIQYLSDKLGIDPEAGLTEEQKAVSFMIRKTMEEYYYFIMIHTRWIDPRGYDVVKGLFFEELPIPLRLVVPKLVQKQTQKALYAQGIGRHDEEEIGRRGRDVLEHLAYFIGKSDYIFGDEPSLVDCVVFPFLWGAYYFPTNSILKKTAEEHPEFRAYVDRILQRYYQ